MNNPHTIPLPRATSEILNELSTLCHSPGYIHAIAFFCCFDSHIMVNPSNYKIIELFNNSSDRLIRTEISTLIGLMIKIKFDIALPPIDKLNVYIFRTRSLLDELHYSMMPNNFTNTNYTTGNMIQEAIFYSGESAYDFQYLDLIPKKYLNDNDWLIRNKKYSIEQCINVFKSILNLQESKINNAINSFNPDSEGGWTLLEGFIFTLDDIALSTDIDVVIVESIINCFSLPNETTNSKFNEIGNFNMINAFPIIPIDDTYYTLLLSQTLLESMYESPYFWFNDDDNYKDKASDNRGDFVENFSYEKLSLVFGQENVFKNVKIKNGKNELGEIDVLVVYANKAIILQAKSKKLTLAARKGNDSKLKEDFGKAIQDAYNQGYGCATLFDSNKLILSDSSELNLKYEIDKIYLICVISDHYPGLNYQAKMYLKECDTSNKILPPIIIDVFLLDIISEMLSQPLYFIDYIDKRALVHARMIASNDILILYYYLKKSIILDTNVDMMAFADHNCEELIFTLQARRNMISGSTTPTGLLTRFTNTPYGLIFKQVTKMVTPEAINFGLLLLSMDDQFISDFNKKISQTKKNNKVRKKQKVLSLLFNNHDAGLTVGFYNNSILDDKKLLYDQCNASKIKYKPNYWYGLNINPNNLNIRSDIICL